jgi:hypothetical protein
MLLGRFSGGSMQAILQEVDAKVVKYRLWGEEVDALIQEIPDMSRVSDYYESIEEKFRNEGLWKFYEYSDRIAAFLGDLEAAAEFEGGDKYLLAIGRVTLFYKKINGQIARAKIYVARYLDAVRNRSIKPLKGPIAEGERPLDEMYLFDSLREGVAPAFLPARGDDFPKTIAPREEAQMSQRIHAVAERAICYFKRQVATSNALYSYAEKQMSREVELEEAYNNLRLFKEAVGAMAPIAALLRATMKQCDGAYRMREKSVDVVERDRERLDWAIGFIDRVRVNWEGIAERYRKCHLPETYREE